MVLHRVTGDLARRFGPDHHIEEVLPLRVAQQVLKVACKPVFDAGFCLLGVPLEGLGQRMYDFGFQVFLPRSAAAFWSHVGVHSQVAFRQSG
jgi:hypothetical protein